jgi:hypothetical protein
MRINTTFNNPLYLFQNFTAKGVSTISNLINDYRTIKSGSYGKLLNAYYDKVADKNDGKNYITYNSSGEIVEGLGEEK